MVLYHVGWLVHMQKIPYKPPQIPIHWIILRCHCKHFSLELLPAEETVLVKTVDSEVCGRDLFFWKRCCC